MKTIFFISLFIIFFFIGITFGSYAVIYSENTPDNFNYKNASIMTCEYANKLTNLTNMQNRIIESCSGQQYKDISYLNCDNLRR